MKNFVLDKWYKYSNNYYIKFKGKDKRDLNKICGETISQKCYVENNYWDSSNAKTEALSNGPLEDLTEIQEYLPDGHIDKFTTKSEMSEDYSCLIKLLKNIK